MMQDAIVHQWLKVAFDGWLYKCGNSSYLRGPTRDVVSQMHNAVARQEHEAVAHYIDRLYDLAARFSASNTAPPKAYTYEIAETRLKCGHAAYRMADKVEAMRLFAEAASKYTGNDHCHAIANWLIGCLQWQFPTRMNDAIISWEESIELFKGLEEASNRVEYGRWYREWHTIMQEKLTEAIAGEFKEPPLEKDWPSDSEYRFEPASSETTQKESNASKSSNSEASSSRPSDYYQSAQLRTFPVIGAIPAGIPVGMLPPEADELAIEIVQLSSGKCYKVVSLRGENLIWLPQDRFYYVLRVDGNSMNMASPVKISNGDFVLMLQQEEAANGDIVAAEIIDVDRLATLKRYHIENGRPVLLPESNDPEFQKPVAAPKGFVIRGVAIAVLKPEDG